MNKKLTIAALAVAAMAGCTNEDSGSNNTLEASFSSAVTRVSGVEWEADDQIGVMVTSSNDLVDTYSYNNCYDVSFTDPTVGIFTAATEADKIYYSVDESVYVDFYAYYPYNSALDASEEGCTINITDQSTPKKIDFMEASTRDVDFVGYNKSSGTVELNFTRNMAKITLELTAGDGVTLSDITDVAALGYYYEGFYSFASNEFLCSTNPVKFYFYKESDSRYSAIVFPVQYASGVDQRICFGFDGYGEVPLDMSAFGLTKGENMTYKVKVSQTEATCEGNLIEDWGTGAVADENKNFQID